jgi:hypothetical protein
VFCSSGFNFIPAYTSAVDTVVEIPKTSPILEATF